MCLLSARPGGPNDAVWASGNGGEIEGRGKREEEGRVKRRQAPTQPVRFFFFLQTKREGKGGEEGERTRKRCRNHKRTWNMFANGTVDSTCLSPFLSVSSTMLPRRELMSPITSPMYSSGVMMSTFYDRGAAAVEGGDCLVCCFRVRGDRRTGRATYALDWWA